MLSQQGRPLLLSLDHCNNLLHMLGRNHACVLSLAVTQFKASLASVPWPCLSPDVGIPLVAFQAFGLGFPRGDPTGLAVESGWTRGGLETTFCFLNERAPMGAKGAPVQPLFSQKITTSPLPGQTKVPVPLANEFGWFSCRPRTKPQVAYRGWTKSTPIGTG